MRCQTDFSALRRVFQCVIQQQRHPLLDCCTIIQIVRDILRIPPVFGGMGGGSSATSMVNSAIDNAFSATDFFDKLMENKTYYNQYHAYLQQLVDKYVNGGDPPTPADNDTDTSSEQTDTQTANLLKAAVARSRNVLFQIFLKERFQLLKWDHVHLIVKVGVVCAGDNEQFLIVAGQLAVSCLTEIARVRLFPVYQQYGRANLAAVLQNRHI